MHCTKSHVLVWSYTAQKIPLFEFWFSLINPLNFFFIFPPPLKSYFILVLIFGIHSVTLGSYSWLCIQ